MCPINVPVEMPMDRAEKDRKATDKNAPVHGAASIMNQQRHQALNEGRRERDAGGAILAEQTCRVRPVRSHGLLRIPKAAGSRS